MSNFQPKEEDDAESKQGEHLAVEKAVEIGVEALVEGALGLPGFAAAAGHAAGTVVSIANHMSELKPEGNPVNPVPVNAKGKLITNPSDPAQLFATMAEAPKGMPARPAEEPLGRSAKAIQTVKEDRRLSSSSALEWPPKPSFSGIDGRNFKNRKRQKGI